MKYFTSFLLGVWLTCFATAAWAAEKPVLIDGLGTSILPVEMTCTAAVGTETMINLETQYDLTQVSPDGYHYARLILYKDPRDMGMASSLIDMVGVRPEMLPMLSDTGKKLVTKVLDEHGLKLLDWSPLSKITVLKHDGVQLGASVILSEKFPVPMYALIALYLQDGKITAIGLLTPDSDRAYWRPVFGNFIENLR